MSLTATLVIGTPNNCNGETSQSLEIELIEENPKMMNFATKSFIHYAEVARKKNMPVALETVLFDIGRIILYFAYEAEDIAIETFSKAFDKIATYDPSYEFKTWLITISKNIHVDLIRKRKRTLDTANNNEDIKKVLDATPSAEDRLITEQNLASLLQHIKKLKPHYQEVINLRFFNELSYADIATELNEPINNVKVKLLRAKKLLAEIIKGNRK